MERSNFILIVEAEHHFSMVARITALFSRNKIMPEELHVLTLTDLQRFTITVTGTRNTVERISQKIESQVDVISVKLFEEAN